MRAIGWPPLANMKRVDLGNWKIRNHSRLHGKSEFPAIELNAIVSHILDKPVSYIVAHPEITLTTDQLRLLEDAVDRLLAGEPLAYITGRQAFFGLDFHVDQRVLIPRPETELLVDHAISWLKTHPESKNIVDIGTGSGVIAITLAHFFPHLEITSIDISPDALEIARINAAFYNVNHQIEFIQGNLLEGITRKFDLILANLPYIPTGTLVNLDVSRFEPRCALDGGADGLELIKKLIDHISGFINPGGCAFLEIQYNQHIAVGEIVARRLPQAVVTVHKDLASLPRIIKIQF